MARTAFFNGRPRPDDQGVHVNAHRGGILFHEKVCYRFGEHNIAHVGVHLHAATDLYNWRHVGVNPAND